MTFGRTAADRGQTAADLMNATYEKPVGANGQPINVSDQTPVNKYRGTITIANGITAPHSIQASALLVSTINSAAIQREDFDDNPVVGAYNQLTIYWDGTGKNGKPVIYQVTFDNHFYGNTDFDVSPDNAYGDSQVSLASLISFATETSPKGNPPVSEVYPR